jgi:outer membrane protein assembly factor BamB
MRNTAGCRQQNDTANDEFINHRLKGLPIFIGKTSTMRPVNALFILSNGRLAAINKKNGDIIWEVKLKQYLNNKISLTIGQLSVEGDKIYVGCSGILLCLNTKDGSLVWKNELKGWGYNFVSIANTANEAASAEADHAAAATVIVASTV